jgi:iron complex outermembrane recepter protein
MQRRILSMAALALAALLASVPSEAQQGLGNIGGTVRNDEGKPVQGATIRVLGTTRGAISKADGSFFIEGIRPGEYEIDVTSMGFQNSSRVIRVLTDLPTTFDVTLSTKPVSIKKIILRSCRMVSEDTDQNSTPDPTTEQKRPMIE